MTPFTAADIPSQAGKLAIITGANGGLGYETALALAGAGADVVVAARNAVKGNTAVRRIQSAHPKADVRLEILDLASLASVADFAGRFLNAGRPIDLLINNAAVMQLPTRQLTTDGFEMQFGTNYLGHFALTGRLLPLLMRAEHPRMTQVSSAAHRQGKIDFDNLQGERKYGPWAAYCQSKLANLMFALEMQRRSDRYRWGVQCNAAHPGYARTDLIANGPGNKGMLVLVAKLIGGFLSHSAADGALPTLLAATSAEAGPSSYFGPDGFYEMKGAAVPAFISKRASDPIVASHLWDVSEALTGVKWPSAVEAALVG